jgi:predicted transcriptional regulator
MKLQTRLRQWWDSLFATTVRPDIVMTILQKAGNQGLTLEELVRACQGSSRSQVDRALRRLREKGLVEKNGDRWRVPKTK